jgi:hypothetical protein
MAIWRIAVSNLIDWHTQKAEEDRAMYFHPQAKLREQFVEQLQGVLAIDETDSPKGKFAQQHPRESAIISWWAWLFAVLFSPHVWKMRWTCWTILWKYRKVARKE